MDAAPSEGMAAGASSANHAGISEGIVIQRDEIGAIVGLRVHEGAHSPLLTFEALDARLQAVRKELKRAGAVCRDPEAGSESPLNLEEWSLGEGDDCVTVRLADVDLLYAAGPGAGSEFLEALESAERVMAARRLSVEPDAEEVECS